MKNFVFTLALMLSLSSINEFNFNDLKNNVEETSYYVCLSTDNYYQSNDRLMSKKNNYYILEGIALSSTNSFAVCGTDGSKYGLSDLKDLTVDSNKIAKYDIIFSPSIIYDIDNTPNEYKVTSCHVSYKLHSGDSCILNINSTNVELNYNPYYSNYNVYYLNEYSLPANSKIIYSETNEEKTIADEGVYQILCITDTNYLFDENGVIGSSTIDRFKYHLYVEKVYKYYIAFENELISESNKINIDEAVLYPLEKNVEYTTLNTYTSEAFFFSSEYSRVKYSIYNFKNNSYVKYGNNSLFSNYITIKDVGWYYININFADLSNTSLYQATTTLKTTKLDNYYLASNKNNYLFNGNGEYVLNNSNVLNKINSEHNDYNSNYDQYVTYLDVNSSGIKFYITDGETKYRNAEMDIVINAPGYYKILFSPNHTYSLNRNYSLSLEEKDKVETEKIVISTANEYNSFARKCNLDANYSLNKEVFLKRDIDFTNVEFVTIDNFQGVFQGTFHTIKNVKLNSTSNYSSLFNIVGINGSIYNLNIENIDISREKESNVGIVGTNYGHLEDITVYGIIKGRNNVGIIGHNAYTNFSVNNSQKIKILSSAINIVNHASITGEYNIGGVAGINEGEIYSSINYGKIYAKGVNPNNTLINIGGIAGISTGKVANVSNYESVISNQTTLYVGGCFGIANGEIYFANNYAKIYGHKYVGGIVGYFGTLTRSTEDLQKYFNNSSFDEFLKTYFPSLNINNNNTDTESGNTDAPSEVVTVAFDYCYSNEEINGEGDVGGLIGHNTSDTLEIKHCVSLSNVVASSLSDCGGIIGSLGAGKVISCLSSNIVRGENDVGGIAGSSLALSEFKGNYTNSLIIGEDNLGGIVGITSGSLTSNISAALVNSNEEKNNAGSIIGKLDLFDDSNNKFISTINSNYYISSLGGINKKEYGPGFDDGAKYISSDDLSVVNHFPSQFSLSFDYDNFLANDKNGGYPVPKYLIEYYYNATFNDENKYQKFFDENISKISNAAKTECQISYIVTFLEWRHDNGDLRNENGNINYNNFEVIDYVRVRYGEKIPSSFNYKYATKKDDYYIYESKDSTYIVSYNIPQDIKSNISIYCLYEEVVTSLFTDDKEVIVEGYFKKGTTISLINNKDIYSIRAFYNGEEVLLKNVTVKFKIRRNTSLNKFYFIDGSIITPIIGEIDSSNYFVFKYSSTQSFARGKTLKVLPTWAVVTIIIASVIGGLAVIALIIIFILWKRKKKVHSANDPHTSTKKEKKEEGKSENKKEKEKKQLNHTEKDKVKKTHKNNKKSDKK